MTRVSVVCLGIAMMAAAAGARVSGQQPVGYFERSGDVGQPAIEGSTTYDAAAQTYTIDEYGRHERCRGERVTQRDVAHALLRM